MFNGKSSTCITSSQSHNIRLLIECLPLLSWRIKWKLKFMLRIFITCTSTCHLYFAKCHVWLTFGLDYSENGQKWLDFIVWNFKHSENTVLHARWNIGNECTKTHENYVQTNAKNCNCILVRVLPTDSWENEIEQPNLVQNPMSILEKDLHYSNLQLHVKSDFQTARASGLHFNFDFELRFECKTWWFFN